jgi:small subunit ribosomal protein S2
MSNTIPTINELFNSGVHFGHQTNKWNPKMSKFIHSNSLGVHIIDLSKTEEMLKKACDFLEEAASNNNQILFVGTKKQASEIIKSEALRCNSNFVSNRWIGGMLTNVTTIRSNIRKLVDLRNKMKSGELESFTKKEKSLFSKEIEKLDAIYSGIETLTGPKVVIIVDPKREATAVKEAKLQGCTVVALADTNTNPENIDYLVPGNDDAIRSISLIVSAFADAIERGRKSYSNKTTSKK